MERAEPAGVEPRALENRITRAPAVRPARSPANRLDVQQPTENIPKYGQINIPQTRMQIPTFPKSLESIARESLASQFGNLDIIAGSYQSIGEHKWILARNAGREELFYCSENTAWHSVWRNEFESKAVGVIFTNEQNGRIIAQDCSFETSDGGKSWIRSQIYLVEGAGTDLRGISVTGFQVFDNRRWEIVYEIKGFLQGVYKQKIEAYETKDAGKSWNQTSRLVR